MARRDDLRREALDELLDLLTLAPRDGGWVGRTPDWYGPVVFGGIGLALTIRAACTGAPDGARLHSLHAHFLRPLLGGQAVELAVEPVRQGRTFTLLHATAAQDGRVAIAMTCSFTADGDGATYDLSGIPDDVPEPEALPDEVDEDPADEDEVGPWEVRWLGPSPARADGTREATHRHWFRIPGPLDDDPHLHAALLGYATDWTGIGGRPLDLEGDTTGMISLDHAAWFHRPPRADRWYLQDVQSLVNAGGRSTLRGVIRDEDGHIVASMAQEMLLLPHGPDRAG